MVSLRGSLSIASNSSNRVWSRRSTRVQRNARQFDPGGDRSQPLLCIRALRSLRGSHRPLLLSHRWRYASKGQHPLPAADDAATGQLCRRRAWRSDPDLRRLCLVRHRRPRCRWRHERFVRPHREHRGRIRECRPHRATAGGERRALAGDGTPCLRSRTHHPGGPDRRPVVRRMPAHRAGQGDGAQSRLRGLTPSAGRADRAGRLRAPRQCQRLLASYRPFLCTPGNGWSLVDPANAAAYVQLRRARSMAAT